MFGHVLFEVGDESLEVDYGHPGASCLSNRLGHQRATIHRQSLTAWFTSAVPDNVGDDVIDILHSAVDAVIEALATQEDWGPSGLRSDQYASDIAANDAALAVLHGAGLRVLSEESGLDSGTGPIAVLDPLDGSTNAFRRLPWFATSLCVVDDGEVIAAVVHDHSSGVRFDAQSGGGARRNGDRLPHRSAIPLHEAIVGLNDIPPAHGGWAQFRCFGAAALDLCAVADGRFDGYVDFSPSSLGPWDYLGGLLVCTEVGVEVLDAHGRDLVITEFGLGRAPVAAPPPLIHDLMAMRASLSDDSP